MSDPVIITTIVCLTLLALTLMAKWPKDRR